MAAPKSERFRSYLRREIAETRANAAESMRRFEQMRGDELRGNEVHEAIRRGLANKLDRHLAKLREILGPLRFAKVQSQFLRGSHPLGGISRRKRRPGEGSMPALVEPPRGPLPLSGGAEAPLEFDS
jgi:hypothetical protein